MSETGDYGQVAGALTKAAGLVQDARQDFTRLSTKMSSDIQSMQSQWGGQGATAFFRLHQAWMDRQNTVVKALDDFAESLTLTERDNVANDEVQASNMSNLLNKLGG
jgi:WXG100 family type VII secretion target